MTRGLTAGVRPDPWLRRFHPAPAGPAPVLVVLPHAGGNASFYFPWSQALAAHAEVLTVQYPGRHDRFGEPVPDTIDALVEGVRAALRPWRDRPLVLFGHSMGAVVAFELARRLEAAGGPDGESGGGPARGGLRGLILSGRRSPLTHREEEHHHTRGDEALLAQLGALAGTDPRLLADEGLRALILPALRGDYRAVETYRYGPGPVLRVPVSVLTGEADPRVSPSEAMAWRELTDGAFTFRGFPGGHFYLTDHQEAVARAIAEDLVSFGAAVR
ncbi:alpha/beta fold hydrolase (plasmid) [Streptomyces sp. NBC_00868]|uniref:thioesterase II family protein n=1 Tax=unclassified Streptomyces TaxID=2593676 RepID=UPI002F917F6C|nr:alpha/beta fold hydrolase [Streptomyces sp. NBC_00868]